MDLFLTRIPPSQNLVYSLNNVEIQEVVKKKKTLFLRKVEVEEKKFQSVRANSFLKSLEFDVKMD
jgi:hypothetical protein